jgi:hypothetical protein
MNRLIYLFILFLCSAELFTAPLESGYSQAPKSTASADEKAQIFWEARYKVTNEASKYINTPYRTGGISKSGMDCSGLLYVSFKDALGVSLPRTTTGIYSWTERITLEQAQIGDILFFKTDYTNTITHAALYLGDGLFIHAASEGSRTGVIYSKISEPYWAGCYAGAGRAFPETRGTYNPAGTKATDSSKDSKPKSSKSNGRFLFGAGVAPTWNFFLGDGDFFRGIASQIRAGVNTHPLNTHIVFGLELRPEYDIALGVFRLPLTLSIGYQDKYTIFAGPVLSFGDASLSASEGLRPYSGGTSWVGTAGVTIAPYIFKTEIGEFAPYLELAWQSYSSDSQVKNLNADVMAATRLSTGIRWTLIR